jgi:hypothetical protein
MTVHELSAFPPMLRRMMESVPQELLTHRSAAGNFSMVETAWHLADLEVEGYGIRLRRLLDEPRPTLPDFQGDVLAEQRGYRHLPLDLALDRFEKARAENVKIIEAASDEDRKREGEQEGLGTVTFERVVSMMEQHDREHREELEALCDELGISGRF